MARKTQGIPTPRDKRLSRRVDQEWAEAKASATVCNHISAVQGLARKV
jgi:hypothetical protein